MEESQAIKSINGLIESIKERKLQIISSGETKTKIKSDCKILDEAIKIFENEKEKEIKLERTYHKSTWITPEE